MKSYYKAGLLVVAGIGLGAVAVETLHAQAKPPIYTVSEVEITNQDGYFKDYAPKIRAVIKAAGGRLMAASQPIAGEGEAPKTRIAIQLWDNLEQWQAYRNSPAYNEARQIGDKYAKFRVYAVEGVAP